MIDLLNLFKVTLEGLGINYEFGEWTSDIVYPYFVGEYQESASDSEDGLQPSTFILTGFSRNSVLELAQAKEKIKGFFKPEGITAIAESGNAMAVSYSHSLVIPTGDAELKKIEIYLDCKEWKVT
jgi:hypothetical protein